MSKKSGKKVVVNVPKHNSLSKNPARGEATLKKRKPPTNDYGAMVTSNPDLMPPPVDAVLKAKKVTLVKKTKRTPKRQNGKVVISGPLFKDGEKATKTSRERARDRKVVGKVLQRGELVATVIEAEKTKRTPKKETGTVRRDVFGDKPEAIGTNGEVISLKPLPPKVRLLQAVTEVAMQFKDKNAAWRAYDLVEDLRNLNMLTQREANRLESKIRA